MSAPPLEGFRPTPTAPAPAPHRDTGNVRVQLLDGFELTVDGRHHELPHSAERLVAYLALRARPVIRSHVAGVLWGERPSERAAACLRSAIWRAACVTGAPLISAGRGQVCLHPAVTVDVRDTVAAAWDQVSGQGVPLSPTVLPGELLPGWDDDWIVVERERLRQLHLEGMEQVATNLLAAGRTGLAIDAALIVVAADPLREVAHRIVVQAHLAAGNRVEALRQYERCRRLLRDELGLPPSDMMTAAAGPLAINSSP